MTTPLDIQRSAWKERHDARAEFAKRKSGENYETLKRAEEWFEMVAYAKQFPIDRPIYASPTHFLEIENQELRQKLQQFSKEELSLLTQEYLFAVKMKKSEKELNALLEKIKQLNQVDLSELEKFQLYEQSKAIGNPNALLKENQLFKSLLPRADKRQKVGCVVCEKYPAQYYYQTHFLVCSRDCALQISSS